MKLDEFERAGLNKLKQYISEDKDIDCVYCYEVSRISRRTNVVYSIRDYLLSNKINLIVLNPYFKLLKDDGTMSETASFVFGLLLL